MKNTKLKLHELKVNSFITNEKESKKVKGGTLIFTTLFFATRADGCPAYSEDRYCTISA